MNRTDNVNNYSNNLQLSHQKETYYPFYTLTGPYSPNQATDSDAVIDSKLSIFIGAWRVKDVSHKTYGSLQIPFNHYYPVNIERYCPLGYLSIRGRVYNMTVSEIRLDDNIDNGLVIKRRSIFYSQYMPLRGVALFDNLIHCLIRDIMWLKYNKEDDTLLLSDGETTVKIIRDPEVTNHCGSINFTPVTKELTNIGFSLMGEMPPFVSFKCDE